MTTDADLRAYLDAHGIDGAPTADGLHVVSFVGGGTAVVESRGRYLLGFGVQFLRGDIRRHAPLRLAAPDLGCGHPAACVRPKTGHAGTTRWCGWCHAEHVAEANIGACDRAERERDAARAEVARLAAVNDGMCRRQNAALDRAMSERDALSAHVSAMKVATLDALYQYAQDLAEGGRPSPGDIIDDVCEAVGIDRHAPYRAREDGAEAAPDDRQWARDLLARLEPTGGYDEEGGR